MPTPALTPATLTPPAVRRREILRLAVPAFGALIAEPLFLLADSAIVGHLGVAELAGVGLASAVLHTAVGLMVFLAYSTTPAVARAIGNGQLPKALAAGRDGVWLALVLGVVLAAAGFGPVKEIRPEPQKSCPTRLMDGRNEIRCWLTAGHEGDCK